MCARYLRSSVQVEHWKLLLRDDAPHLLPRLVLLAVLQEAADDAAAGELARFDLQKKRTKGESDNEHLTGACVCLRVCFQS